MRRGDARRAAHLGLAIVLAAIVACSPNDTPSTVDTASARPSIPTIRGAYGRDDSPSGFAVMRSVGLDTVTAPPDRETLDRLHEAGMRAIVWLGAYDRQTTQPCAFERNDRWIRDKVTAVAGNPAIAAYQIADEPDASLTRCPDTVQAIADRAALVHALDDSAPTYVTITRNGSTDGLWRSVDILGLVVYPVSVGGYNAGLIPAAIAEAEQAHVARYWAVIQDFGTPSWYVVPTADELQEQFDQWRAAPLEGYVIYHWALAHVDERPDQLAVLRGVNGAAS